MKIIPTTSTFEVIRVVAVAAELYMAFFDNCVTFVADVFPASRGFLPLVTFSTQCSKNQHLGAERIIQPSGIPQKANIGQDFIAKFACETFRMPTGIHSLDNSADNELVYRGSI